MNLNCLCTLGYLIQVGDEITVLGGKFLMNKSINGRDGINILGGKFTKIYDFS